MRYLLSLMQLNSFEVYVLRYALCAMLYAIFCLHGQLFYG
jgi:hypothetical protein